MKNVVDQKWKSEIFKIKNSKRKQVDDSHSDDGYTEYVDPYEDFNKMRNANSIVGSAK